MSLDYTNIPTQYKNMVSSLETFKDSPNINLAVIQGSCGTGKSFWCDYAVKELGINHSLFKGEMSEAKAYEFMQQNHDKTIVLRDGGHLLRRIGFLDMLKSATDNMPVRTISRNTYAKHENLEPQFDFTGKIILELNELPQRHREDVKALMSRGFNINLDLSFDDIVEVMKSIAKLDWQKEVTDFLIETSHLINRSVFNLRTQQLCLAIYQSCQKNKTDWKAKIVEYFNNQVNEGRKLLYRFVGNGTAKRIDFVKFLMADQRYSYSTCNRRIREWLFMGDIFSNKLEKRQSLSLIPYGSNNSHIKKEVTE